MHRRLIGVLLSAAALILAVIIPALGGLRVAGSGGPIQLPGSPRVGDCLLESLNDIILIQRANSGSSLAPSFAPCDGRNVGGQVTAVVQGFGDVRARLRQAAASGVDCYQTSLEYSGLVLSGGRRVLADHSLTDPVDWNLTINVRTAWVVPAPLLRTAGQTWVACIAAPMSGTAYQGQLAAAFTGGKLPDEFGFCWQQSTPSANGAVSCGSRHFAELVSLGTISDNAGIDLADIEGSCQRLAAQVIGRSDPTAAGHLTIRTSVSSGAGTSSIVPETLRVVCYVEPVLRPLAGTVVGLGDGPVPYAR